MPFFLISLSRQFFLVSLCIAFITGCSVLSSNKQILSSNFGVTAGDRQPKTHAIYPDSVFFHNGGRVINIKAPPFSAKGDGKTDDTKAIVKAYDFIVQNIREKISAGDEWPIADSYIIYFPAGIYLVSDTIEYSGRPLTYRDYAMSEGLNNIRFQGESRHNSIIKLADSSVGFEIGKKKALLSLARRDNNNLQTFNSIENLTLDTGFDNPGAVGINHAGANKTTLRNLTIRSEDGKGKAGISISTSPTQGYHTDLSIEGFEYGILMTPYHVTHNSFEYITLANQSKAAIMVEDSTASFRALEIKTKSGAGIIQKGKGSQLAIVESVINSTSKETKNAAVIHMAGSILVRNVFTKNFQNEIKSKNSEFNSNSFIDEFTYPPRILNDLSDSRSSTLNLQVEDEPPISYPTSKDGWAVVDDFITVTELSTSRPDYYMALKRAFASGKSHILFGKNQNYFISGSLSVPSHIETINGLHTTINKDELDGSPIFIVDKHNLKSLTIENFHFNSNIVNHESSGTLLLRNLGSRGSTPYRNTNSNIDKKLFLTVVTNFGRARGAIVNQKVWARWINTESPFNTNFPIEASDMWVFGYKTEKFQTSFSARNFSRLEVLGGVTNQFFQSEHSEVLYSNNGISPYPAFFIENSQATIFACTNGPNRKITENYDIMIEVWVDGKVWKIKKENLPRREGRSNQVFIPLTTINFQIYHNPSIL